MKTFREYINLIENAQSSVTESDDDKVRQLTTMEYRHISFLAREAGIVLGGLGADKVTGDLYWSGTKDGRNVNGVVKRVVSDADMDREEQLEETEADPVRRIEELFCDK
jgi:hypothetical protein